MRRTIIQFIDLFLSPALCPIFFFCDSSLNIMCPSSSRIGFCVYSLDNAALIKISGNLVEVVSYLSKFTNQFFYFWNICGKFIFDNNILTFAGKLTKNTRQPQ